MPAAAPVLPTLLFVHGWAFDAAFWGPLAAALADWPQAVANAGYFGPPHTPAPAGPVLAIGHSLGALRLLGEPPPACVGLVAINGFARFGAGADFPEGVPARMLDRMLNRLATQPETVLRDFRQRCGDTSAIGVPQVEPLARDLGILRDADQRAALATLPMPLLALAGTADPIAPTAMTTVCFGAAAELHWRDGGGHLLPLTDPDWCAQRIRAFLARVAPAA
ncbi:alpha/beta fold hydrolase [Achromobacter xylosoxidans]|uniref:alpha/beta fold hydrolase n=1 Tax=Alcaligenes xylosoxydans xylosoxydans TaxID=85698 RepID=UPI0012327CB8|nr:alpha/beta hydrolase [Achromobacter xylosoxidans]KAA5926448.1 alpha/beta fold hydrolase [Achromobacter xylosoxidans]